MKKREIVRINIVIDKENKDFADKEIYNLSAFLNKALTSYRKKVQKEKDASTSHNIYCDNNKYGYKLEVVDEEEDENDLPF